MNLLTNKGVSPSDSTLLPSGISDTSPAATTGNNVFSRANVFGIFLALAFCLLSQPYGSILYMRPSNILGRILFFFWRLNPLACAAEAFLILYIFLNGARTRWQDYHHVHHDRMTPMTFRKRIHLTADAILLLRAYTHLPEQWAAFADRRRWQTGRVNEIQSPRGNSVDEAAPIPPLLESSTDIVDEQRQGYEREAPMENRLPLSSQTSSVPQQTATIAPSNLAATNSTPSPGSQSQHRIESGHQPGLQGDVAAAIHALRSGQTTMGGRNLTSAERLIHLISVIAVIVVMVKIIAIDIPTYIHVTAWFMISSWTMVELVVALSRRDHGSCEAAHDAALLRCAFVLQSRLHASYTWTALYLLCLPVLLYISHVTFYKTDNFTSNTSWRMLARTMMINLFLGCLSWYTVIKDFKNVRPLFRRPKIRLGACVAPSCKPMGPPRLSSIAILFGVLLFLALITLLGYGYACLEQKLGDCAVDPTGRTCGILLTTNTTVWFSAWFFTPTILFASSEVSQLGERRRSMNNIQITSLIWNLLTTTLCFVVAMKLYKAETTHKPDWLDWLGRLRKWTRGTDAV